MKANKLYWAFCYTHGCKVVFADHPKAGRLFMGRTMAEARQCAEECDWL